MTEVLVVGGGVVGLTTAHVLLERGHEVRVAAKEWSPAITSGAAAAFWYPYAVAHAQAAAWAARANERYRALARAPATGVSLVEARFLHRKPTPVTEWARAQAGFRELDARELPAGYACGHATEVPLVETPRYMAWLRDEVARRGAKLETRAFASLAEASREARVVVNATGVGARDLAGDASVVPIRGDVVKLPPGLVDHVALDEDDDADLAYVVPRADGTIVGGTHLKGDWGTDVREDVWRGVLARGLRLAPLPDGPILDVRVGLRPWRPTVRVEAERVAGANIVHHYGHGGAGFTLSWGSAEAAAGLVEAHDAQAR